MNKMKKIIYLMVLALLVSGCVSPNLYIRSDMDSDYKLAKQTDKIYVLIIDDADIRTREFGKLLIHEMKDAGFNIVDNVLNSDITLCYTLDQRTSQIDLSLPITAPSYTKGSFSTYGAYGSGNGTYSQTTTKTQYIPYSVLFTVKSVLISLYPTMKFDFKKSLWEGYLGVEEGTFKKYAKDCVRMLLSHYGKNFDGHVSLTIEKINKRGKPDIESFNNQRLEEKDKIRNEMADFARQHKDFAELRLIMYKLSLDPRNATLTLQELYDMAQKQTKK